MNKSISGEIRISQTLHGYRDGHKLLAGSLAIDEYASIEMARMSDLMPGYLSDSSTYFCAYPLKSINKYVFSKTWAANEMSRPGCVWTHSLLLDYLSVAKINNLFQLLGLFRRPVENQYFEYLDDFLLGLDTNVHSKIDKYQSDFQLNEVEIRKAITGLYFGNSSKVFLSYDQHSKSDSITPILMWNQMPPRLRREFVFCTLGNIRSIIPVSELALIIVDEVAPQSDYSELDNEIVIFLYDDILRNEQNEFRAFISRYIVDANDARKSVSKLAKIAKFLFVNETQKGLRDSSKAILEVFPDSNDCRLLKREFLNGSIIDTRKIGEHGRYELVLDHVLPILKFLKDFDDFDAIKQFLLQMEAQNVVLSKLISQCLGAPRYSLGYFLLKAVCESYPLELVASLPFDADVKLILASFNDKLIAQPEFWSTFNSQPNVEDLEALKAAGDVKLLAKGFLAGKMYEPFRVLLKENSQVLMPHLVCFIEKLVDTTEQPLVVEFRAERVRIVEYLVNCRDEGIGALTAIANDVFVSPYPEISTQLWIDLFSKNPSAIRYLSPQLAFVLFEQAGWCASRQNAVYLYKLSFDTLHDLGIQEGQDVRSVIAKIISAYPSDGTSGYADISAKVRRKICNFFETTNLYAEFLEFTHDNEKLRKLFVSMSQIWSGKEWLRRLLNAADAGDVKISIQQRNLLISVIPPRRKNFLDLWFPSKE